ncbi:glutamic acid-rich protein-like isoform X2 [Erpetoichthys calabaricus]|uniref:glutamic acid-rich protein-like isoform X2 n=1 Tax=Erpetoichthys calabaricus TaxID=27687 RepID=UPI002234B744|nr:glutamic acid-rich protein-like isoform X2 [Erpetoichthys calabaricus]
MAVLSIKHRKVTVLGEIIMKTFMLLAILLSLALSSQAAGLNLEDIVQGLNDLADNKRELEMGNVEDESQDMQEGEMDETELQDDSSQLEGQGDDQQQKRELDFEENENEDEEDLLSQRELGEKSVDLQNENTEANSKRWYGCRYSHRWFVCKRGKWI